MYSLKIEEYASDYGIPADNFINMYNPEQKMKFVDDTYGGQNQDLIIDKIRFLNICGNEEAKQKKDLNEFNTVELADLFESLKIINNASVSNRKNLIKQYFEWSVVNKLINITAIEQIKNLSSDKIQSDNVIDKLYFKDYKDVVNGYDTIVELWGKQLDNDRADLFKVFLDLAWSGLSMIESATITTNDIDNTNNVIHINGKEFKVPENIMFDIVSRGQLVTHNDKLFLLNILERTALTDIKIISEKDMLSRFSNFKKVINSVNKNDRFYNHSFTYEKIRKSGVFYRMYQYEKDNNVELSYNDKKKLSELSYLNLLTDQKMYNWINNYHTWRSCFYGY